MACHLLVVAVGLLSTCTASFAPILWANAPGKDLTLLPHSFTGPLSKWSNDIPQKLAVGETIDNRMALFSPKPDNTISVEGWCIEAVGAKSGDAVNVNICNGAATQQWNWIPEGHGRNKIQLKDTNLCLDVDHKEGRLNGAAVQLLQCRDTSSESWLYEAPKSGSDVQHVMMVLMSLVGVAAFRLGARRWQRPSKAPIVACGMPFTAGEDSGVAMTSVTGGRAAPTPYSRTGVAHMSMGAVPDDELVSQAKVWASSQRAAARSPPTVAVFFGGPEDDCLEEECASDTTATPYTRPQPYHEESRKSRRTVYMHDEWKKHRSPTRFVRNLSKIFESGVIRSLNTEIFVATGISVLVFVANGFLVGYTDLEGVKHAAPLAFSLLPNGLVLPAMPFQLSMTALSLLLVFRTNTAYFRWNEGRTLWGGLINTTRNVVRQANMYFPNGPEGDALREVLAAQTVMFAKSLRCFLRGPEDEPVLYAELREIVGDKQAQACLQATNKPMFSAGAMSTTVRAARKLGLNEMDSARIDQSIAQLVDICGANERIFKSPIPLVYTRHTARFLSAWLFLLPLVLYDPCGSSWNHWVMIPTEFFMALFLFGIEELGIQIEEPFGILPLEALCNGAIEATIKEQMTNNEKGDYYVS